MGESNEEKTDEKVRKANATIARSVYFANIATDVTQILRSCSHKRQFSGTLRRLGENQRRVKSCSVQQQDMNDSWRLYRYCLLDAIVAPQETTVSALNKLTLGFKISAQLNGGG
jgi:hypothetical protein